MSNIIKISNYLGSRKDELGEPVEEDKLNNKKEVKEMGMGYWLLKEEKMRKKREKKEKRKTENL